MNSVTQNIQQVVLVLLPVPWTWVGVSGRDSNATFSSIKANTYSSNVHVIPSLYSGT
jgi:hypothetical protein